MNPPHVTYELLKSITGGFSKNNIIGRGSYGVVYRGTMPNGDEVAVKKFHDDSSLGLDDDCFSKEFENLIRMVHHANIVRIVSYCYEQEKVVKEINGQSVEVLRIYRVLCFEYLPKGSLDRYLSAYLPNLDWHTSYKIIKGIFEALKYIHLELRPAFYHLDIKPGNILLDEKVGAKLADFGLSKIFLEKLTRTTGSSYGTQGYSPPEFNERHHISEKFDIFSTGVVILQLVTGLKGYPEIDDTPHTQFIDEVQQKWRAMLRREYKDSILEAYCKQVKKCVEIGLKCVEKDRKKRPEIQDTIDQLTETEKCISMLDTVRRGKSLSSDVIKSEQVGGKKGTARDIEEQPSRLESLTISYFEVIHAFSFSYIDKAGKQKTVGPWGTGYSHPQKQTKTIFFEPSEFVEEVSGFYGTPYNNILMMSLTFVTNIRTYGPFGNPYHVRVQSTPFSFRASEDSSIVGFHGRSGRHLYSIGVYMTQCPSNMKISRPLPMPGQILPTPTKTGPWGGSAGVARDINEKPWRLESLTISYLGLIDAFSFSYTDQAGKKHSIGPWGQGYHHDKIETIRFDISEFVEEVSGAYGSHFGNVLVTSLTFVTNIRTYGPFGNAHHQNVPATPFRFKADKDSRIVGFHGRSYKHLYSIGVYTV
ncbi:cysteine-rich receptor-like protein kinase 34 isoform X2 [Miscanthus floridulus]|uniref:cysteine-rich receptor-like protein kinase 34 isoform X2 n=1 Tax=Miscanthus floridulus TaxID=154761 RepID=UPI0034579EF8